MIRSHVTVYMILISWVAYVSAAEFNWTVGEKFEPTKRLGEFCNFHGYPFEVHYIHSYDGYILQIHRIPPLKRSDLKPAEAVLLMHGLLSSSADFIVTGPNISLAMLMHDRGYDVWLGNSRGNSFSRNHTTLSPSDYSFWNFSWHEIGLNDAAATIDFIRNFTGQQKIFYVGYSQGTTQFWVLTSLKPEYNERVKLMMALAPVAYMGHVKGGARFFTRAVIQAIDQYEKNGYFELLSSSSAMRRIGKVACGRKSKSTKKGTNPVCESVMVLLGGYTEDLDYENLGNTLIYVPAGCSCKQLIHYALGIQNPGHFRLFDYNYEKNMRLYNSSVPPEYPLHKITLPVALYNSVNDYLAAPEDVNLLRKQLPNVVEKFTVKAKKLNHFDFAFGTTVRPLIYERMLKRMKEYSDL